MIGRIRQGNLWEYQDKGEVVGITTNGSLKKDGTAVLGAGIAKQAKERFPDLPMLLGDHIQKNGNIPAIFELKSKNGEIQKLITIPVKHEWFQDANIDLIKKSLREIRQFPFTSIYIPKPGVVNGRLEWNNVRQAITPIINNSNIYIVDIAEPQLPLFTVV